MSKLLNGIINYIGANGIFKNNDGDIPITSGNIILDNGKKLMSKNSQGVAKNIVGYNTDKVVFNYNDGGTGVDAELFGNSITASAGGGVNINNTSNGTTDIILQSNARFTSTIGANTTTNNKITLSSDDGNVDIYTYRKITRSGTTQTHENTYTFTPTGQLQGIQTPSSDTNAANKKYVDDSLASAKSYTDNYFASAYHEFTFTAKSAGASGVYHFTWNLANDPYSIIIRASHPGESGSVPGAQFSVNYSSKTEVYVSYYCPRATTQETIRVIGYYKA